MEPKYNNQSNFVKNEMMNVPDPSFKIVLDFAIELKTFSLISFCIIKTKISKRYQIIATSTLTITSHESMATVAR